MSTHSPITRKHVRELDVVTAMADQPCYLILCHEDGRGMVRLCSEPSG